MNHQQPPLILHVIHHLVVGGMENGLVNIINQMPRSEFRHAIACVEDYSDFRKRITVEDVQVYGLHRSRIGAWRLRRKLYQLCRTVRPTIVHTRNLSGLDALLPARLAGVRHCIHGEHGLSVHDVNSTQRKSTILRQLHSPLVSRYIAVSKQLEKYLTERIGVSSNRIQQIYNGVDTERFKPDSSSSLESIPSDFRRPGTVVIGAVGRLQPIKDQATLLKAVAKLVNNTPELRSQVRLAVVGDGPLLDELRDLADTLRIIDVSWFPGTTSNVPAVLNSFDVFVLPSLSEGISNTILEAMAVGLPVLATAVGGNVELIQEDINGRMFDPGNVEKLAQLLLDYVNNNRLREEHGRRGLKIAREKFSLPSMINQYHSVYEQACRN